MAGKKHRGGHAEHENEERWLLTYADMITLLMALFMVLFSISSVNISKYQTLQQSLKAAFSGSVLSGGRNILAAGSESTSNHSSANADIPAIVPLTPNIPKPGDTSARQIAAAMESESQSQGEQATFAHLRDEINAYARAHGFSKNVDAIIEERGLVVRVLTDKLLFTSGSATLQPAGEPLLAEVAKLLDLAPSHPVTVEGNTDDVPVDTTQFPSNWELSTDRAATVVRYLITQGVAPERLAAAGYADLHPVASNATVAGRALNRRVDIVLNRLYPAPTSY